MLLHHQGHLCHPRRADSSPRGGGGARAAEPALGPRIRGGCSHTPSPDACGAPRVCGEPSTSIHQRGRANAYVTMRCERARRRAVPRSRELPTRHSLVLGHAGLGRARDTDEDASSEPPHAQLALPSQLDRLDGTLAHRLACARLRTAVAVEVGSRRCRTPGSSSIDSRPVDRTASQPDRVDQPKGLEPHGRATRLPTRDRRARMIGGGGSALRLYPPLADHRLVVVSAGPPRRVTTVRD